LVDTNGAAVRLRGRQTREGALPAMVIVVDASLSIEEIVAAVTARLLA
jgi:hypothetical protein